MKKSILRDKSYAFALRIVQLAEQIKEEKREHVLSRQLLRSGTAICALISEATFAQSMADFIHKMRIALKEANETIYWLSLLKDSNFYDEGQYEPLNKDCNELIALLVASINTGRKRGK